MAGVCQAKYVEEGHVYSVRVKWRSEINCSDENKLMLFSEYDDAKALFDEEVERGKSIAESNHYYCVREKEEKEVLNGERTGLANLFYAYIPEYRDKEHFSVHLDRKPVLYDQQLREFRRDRLEKELKESKVSQSDKEDADFIAPEEPDTVDKWEAIDRLDRSDIEDV